MNKEQAYLTHDIQNDPALSVRISNALAVANITTIGDLLKLNERELMQLPNIGKKCLGEIKDRVTELQTLYGLTLKP